MAWANNMQQPPCSSIRELHQTLAAGELPAEQQHATTEAQSHFNFMAWVAGARIACIVWRRMQVLYCPCLSRLMLPYRCCLAVHHCGVGTCGAVLRAGIPSVPCPVMLDQPFLAHRLVEAGVACSPLPFHKISAQVELCSLLASEQRECVWLP